jgi:exodeoxyribonuclease-3
MSLRLLSYNIRYGGRGRVHSLTDVIRVAGPDVVLLQEATDPSVIEALSRETSLPHWGSRPDYSMGFLSKLPVAHHAWYQPRDSRHHFLELSLESVECRIFGLHLVAWFSKWTERKRAREIRALLDGIREHQHGFHLIAGDFNALAPGELLEVRRMPRWIRAMIWLSGRDISRETIQLMLDEGYVDAWRRLHPNDLGYVDRIAVCEVLGTPPEHIKDASDHAPILVEVR